MENNAETDFPKEDESKLQVEENQEIQSVSYPAVCGHHYFNPQWVMYDQQTPALLYNNAVYFTVSFDGTHYFHEQYQGQFCAPPEAAVAASEQEEAQENTADTADTSTSTTTATTTTTTPRVTNDIGHYDDNHDCYNMWNQPQVLFNPYLNPWQRNTKPKRPFKQSKNKKDSRQKRDVRTTMVPMFPEAFALGRETWSW